MQAWARHQRREPLHEFQRRHKEVRGAITISRLKPEHHLPGRIEREPFFGHGRASDIAAQVFEFLALVGATTHRRAQAEAVRVGAQWDRGLLGSGGNGLQAQHYLPRAGSERDAIGARGRLQGGKRAVRVDLGEVSQALLFNERVLSGQQPHAARDDLEE